MRRIILGLLLGATLSGLRARAGQSLFEFPAPTAISSYGIRALGLLSCALALFHGRRLFHDRKQNTLLLLGLSLGYALHGVFVLPFQSSTSALFIAALVVVPPLLVRMLRRRASAPSATPAGEDALGLAALGGLALCAAGVTLALEGTARELRLLGSAASLDDTIFGSVFLILATFGALAFARSLGQVRQSAGGDSGSASDGDWGRARAVETALVIGAGLTLLSQRSLLALSSKAGLREFMRSYGQDTFDNGMFAYDGLLATSAWIAPAFAVGTAIGCARRASELAAMALGAALALLAIPLRMAAVGAQVDAAVTSASLVQEGILLAAAGALATLLLRGRGRSGLPRTVGLIAAAAVGAAPFVFPPHPVLVAAPWKRLPSTPSLVFESAAGQVSVSPGGADVDVVDINGLYLTPNIEEATADRKRIVESVNLLDDTRRLDGLSVLLIGQLTPGRALTLTDLGATRIDRSGAWYRIMPRLEEKLFLERGHRLPAGEVLSPTQARRQFASYDLVLALVVKGEAPLIPRELAPEPGPVVVLWIDAGFGVHRRELPGPVLLAADGTHELGLAIVHGLPVESVEPGVREGRAFFAPGAARDRTSAWRERLVRSSRRHEEGLYLLTDRLATANTGNGLGELARGLSIHYGAQHRSSMFETPEQQVELDMEALTTLSDALGPGRPPDRFAREIWSGLARVLVGQREIVAIYDYLEPLVELWGPWPELELALAHADLESLAPADALQRLAPLEGQPGEHQAMALEMAARARAELADHEGAADTLRQLGRVAPGIWQRRQLAIEATLAGQPDGRALLEEQVAEFPEDAALRALLEDGVAPEGPGAPGHNHLNHDH